MIDYIVPAHNEENTIGPILNAIRSSSYAGQLVVVCDSCTDNTYSVAIQYDATVLPVHFTDKGSAMNYGLEHTTTERIGFVDADLTGLTTTHIDELSQDFPGQVCGLFPWNTPTQWSPPITGQRTIPRWVVSAANIHGKGWQAEHRINAVVGRYGLPWRHTILDGVVHKSKIEEGKILGYLQTIGRAWATAIQYGPDLYNYTTNPNGRQLTTWPKNEVLQ